MTHTEPAAVSRREPGENGNFNTRVIFFVARSMRTRRWRAPSRAQPERPETATSDHVSPTLTRIPKPTLSTTRLIEWAILAPEEAKVYSTRTLGQPITLLKRGLVRLLRQYLNEVNAQQSRFNALVAAHVMRLEQRVEELERKAAEREPPAR